MDERVTFVRCSPPGKQFGVHDIGRSERGNGFRHSYDILNGKSAFQTECVEFEEHENLERH